MRRRLLALAAPGWQPDLRAPWSAPAAPAKQGGRLQIGVARRPGAGVVKPVSAG
jgi:hypothetical protein